jgi:cell fate regulator YaaT (PSP1 superfamily)
MPICRHLVRVGSLGNVGLFDSVDATRYRRGTRVICRTARGLELGEILSPWESLDASLAGRDADGQVLRPVTVEDDLLLARIAKRQDEAFAACARLVEARGLGAVLVDVELLFDGSSLYFYFLGETTPELESLTAELAEAYEAEVQFRRFAETLATGCGPDCGTDQAAGCQSGSCSSCVLAASCGTRK